MTDVVLDASVAIPAVSDRTPAGRALRERLGAVGCHSPHLIDAEVGSVLRRQVLRGALAAGSAGACLAALGVLVTERYHHQPLVQAAWRLRANLSFYDALYVALAARLELPLLTADVRLAHAPDLPCDVEIIR